MLNFNLTTLRVAANYNPPYIFMKYDYGIKNWDLTGGSEYQLLMVFSEIFNFTYSIINCGEDWGTSYPNNTWTGIIGMLATGRADLGMSEISITYERSKMTQFSYPFTITWVTFMTSLPNVKTNFEIIFDVFGPIVWLFCILSLVLIFLVIRLFSKAIPVLKKIHLSWSSVAALLNQPMTCYLPPNMSIKILIYFWILSCLVLTKSYSQCLYSLMAIPLKSKTIDTIQELADALKDNKISVRTDKSSSAYELIKNSEFSLYQEIGEYLQIVENEEKLVEYVVHSKVSMAFITVIEYLRFVGLIYGEQSFHLPQPSEESTFFLDFISIGFRNDFEFRREFQRIITRLKEGGFFEHWMTSESRKAAENNKRIDRQNDFKDLNVDQIQSFFYLLLIGNSFGFFVLFIEILFVVYT